MTLICLVNSGMMRPVFVPSCMVSPIIFMLQTQASNPEPTHSPPAAFRSNVCNLFMCFHSGTFRRALSHWDACAFISLARKGRLARHCSAFRRWPGVELFSCYDIITASVEPGLCPEEIQDCHVPTGWLMNRPWSDITVTRELSKGGSRLPSFLLLTRHDDLSPLPSLSLFPQMLAYSLPLSLWNMLINTLYVGHCSV